MFAKLPEFNFTVPTPALVWGYARATIMAACVIVGLVALAHWRSNSRLDRDGLEQLAKGAAVTPLVKTKASPR